MARDEPGTPTSVPDPDGKTGAARIRPREVAAALLAILAIVFAFQNNDQHTFTFWVADVSVRSWVAILVALVVGMVIGALATRSWRLRRRDRSGRG